MGITLKSGTASSSNSENEESFQIFYGFSFPDTEKAKSF